MIIGLLPCAGTASRLHGLPKFMLPLKEGKGCLLSRWIKLLLEKGCDKVIIGCSSNNFPLVESVITDNNLTDCVIIKNLIKTLTMNETIIRSLENENFDKIVMAMPDTYVDDIDINFLGNNIVGVNLWNIRDSQVGKLGQCNIQNEIVTDITDKDSNCHYNYGWGVIVFTNEFMKYILTEEPHTGYSLKNFIIYNKLYYKIISGLYFDCGTVEGYREFLNSSLEIKPMYIKGTIIIMAIYINDKERSYEELIKCLNQVRKIYPNEIIIGVNNSSLNDKWKSLAKQLNIQIIDNNDSLYRYEMGAYKKALEYYRADNYICIQGTFFLNNKFDISSLNVNKPNAMCFEMINNLSWDQNGLKLIDKYLATLNFGRWADYSRTLLWDSFVCNNLFLEEMFKDGIFTLIVNVKDHSFAMERILGYYFTMKLGNVGKINCGTFNKIVLNQI